VVEHDPRRHTHLGCFGARRGAVHLDIKGNGQLSIETAVGVLQGFHGKGNVGGSAQGRVVEGVGCVCGPHHFSACGGDRCNNAQLIRIGHPQFRGYIRGQGDAGRVTADMQRCEVRQVAGGVHCWIFEVPLLGCVPIVVVVVEKDDGAVSARAWRPGCVMAPVVVHGSVTIRIDMQVQIDGLNPQFDFGG